MECRSRFGEGDGLSNATPSNFPAWRAFGPGASTLLGWEPPRAALPRTALRLEDGQGKHWDSHLFRLRLGAASLGWDVSWLSGLESEIESWVSTAGLAACRLQLFPDTVSVRLEDIPDPISSYRMLAMNHPLGDIRSKARAGIKGLLGSWDIQAWKVAHEKAAEDALLIWPDGTIAETAIASIGLQVDGHLILPPLEGRISSITEALDLPLWTLSRGLTVQRRPMRLDEVPGGQLWCMNAVRGLWQAEMVLGPERE